MISHAPTLSSKSTLLVVTVITIIAAALLVYFFRPQPVTGKPGEIQPSIGGASSTVELIPASAPLEGPFAAKVTIVEFLDYQCPGCGAYHPVLKQMREEFAGKIKFVVRQFPLVEIHPFAKGAAISTVCAQRQGKFFEYSDVLFQNQDYLRRTDLERYAEEMGLKMDEFKTCLDDPAAEAQVIRDRKDGEALGIPGTPSVFINGKLMDELLPPDQLRQVIQRELSS